MRSPLPIAEQITLLRTYLRTLRADTRRAYQELESGYRKRRVCPLMESLRYERARHAYEFEDIGEACLKQLRKAQAINVAPFFPGDVISVEVVMKGYERPAERYVVYDVEPGKWDEYHYVVWQLTKSGALFKRGTTWICPSSRVRLTKLDDELPDETKNSCEYFAERAKRFLKGAVEEGRLEDVTKAVREARAKRGW